MTQTEIVRGCIRQILGKGRVGGKSFKQSRRPSLIGKPCRTTIKLDKDYHQVSLVFKATPARHSSADSGLAAVAAAAYVPAAVAAAAHVLAAVAAVAHAPVAAAQLAAATVPELAGTAHDVGQVSAPHLGQEPAPHLGPVSLQKVKTVQE